MPNIVSRSSWGATAGLGAPMPLPASEVWLHHSVTSVTSSPHSDMRVIERVGIQRFGRFSYSWAVHPDGTILEGAGFTVGAHTGGRNSRSFGIVLIGNYDEREPTTVQLAAVAGLIRWLVQMGRLRPGTYPTGGHRDLKSTACPGSLAYHRIGELRRLVANPTEDDMPLTTDDLTKIQNAVRGVLNEGTGNGQKSWAETSAATLAGVQGNANRLNTLAGKIADIDVSVDGMHTLTDGDLSAIATAVADEQHRRSAG